MCMSLPCGGDSIENRDFGGGVVEYAVAVGVGKEENGDDDDAYFLCSQCFSFFFSFLKKEVGSFSTHPTHSFMLTLDINCREIVEYCN